MNKNKFTDVFGNTGWFLVDPHAKNNQSNSNTPLQNLIII